MDRREVMARKAGGPPCEVRIPTNFASRKEALAKQLRTKSAPTIVGAEIPVPAAAREN